MELGAEQLVVHREGRVALSHVSLSLPRGQRALLTGPAGCGKSTLLKALAGLLSSSSGRVLWDGNEVASLSSSGKRAGQARLGMVFQTDALFDSLDVLENVLLPLRRRKVPQEQAQARAQEVLERVGLQHALHSLPEQLSGGMRKRVGIARAIVSRPEVLLADDPLAGLDPRTAASVCELLWEVSADRSLLVCAPEPPEWLELPLRWRLEEGRLLS